MITFENGALTIDTSLSMADSQAISAFADTVRNGEQERIIKLLKEAYIGGYCFESVELVALVKGEK